jgi:hypothetical protein
MFERIGATDMQAVLDPSLRRASARITNWGRDRQCDLAIETCLLDTRKHERSAQPLCSHDGCGSKNRLT